ncbi:preprotein translocase subunit SecA [Roseiflexus sp. AH-315-K22]|nr:preprotein translocase subunit SecA [Roseiflexus sp. AH-315-K22]
MASQGIPVIEPVLNWLIGSRNERFVKKYTQRVEAMNALEPQNRKLTDAQLRDKIDAFRQQVKDGAKVEEVMIDAFAVAREAMDRSVGIRNIFNPEHGFDPQTLPADVRDLYEKTKAEMDALPTLRPETMIDEAESAVPDEEKAFLGWDREIPGWMQGDIPNEIYEAVRVLYPESRPPFRARPFDVQLIGAMVLSQGKISEMKTGEGKTIVAPLAAYLACIEKLKVHVVTVNDYLVQRDRDWVAPFFRALGLTVGAIHPMHMQGEDIKRLMYECDVVYGTTSEFGFDYLRDNMKRSVRTQVQRRREYAIVDEVDSILIDEARTPLIISGPAHEDQPRYELADSLARHLVETGRPWADREALVVECKKRIKGLEGDIRNARDKSLVPPIQAELAKAREQLPILESERDEHTQYYEVKEDRKQVHLTHEGIAEAQRKAGVGSFYVDENMDLPHLLEQSLRAHVVYVLDKDYIVAPMPDAQTGRQDVGIVIVDSFTGRPMYGRQWSDGLHQAIECKEKVQIKQETQTVATITIQNFFKMYKRLSGMTGTADTEAQEFHDIYKLDVVSIPTNKPMIRGDYDDLMYLVGKDKWDGIVDEIKRFHDIGQPILVGTTSVERSEMLAQMLSRKHQIQHNVLNAKQHEREANIVENAGQLGAVMIATNMAGRGTDIKLGEFTREALLEHWLKRGMCSRGLTPESTEEELRENVFRKLAPATLDMRKRDVEEMPFEELELKILRHWAMEYTWASDRKIESMSAEQLRNELDDSGRIMYHRIRWFKNVEELGGLHVIGTERHESRRIDNQLRGRSGRQGDHGSSRFFVSLDDELMKMFAGETTMRILSRLGMKEGDAIEHPMLSKSVERAQRKVEERNFQVRKNILEYDEVMEHQRQAFYGLRQRVLEGRDVKGLMLDYIEDATRDACDDYLDKDYPARCAAEFAKEKLDCSIMADRLRGRDLAEMEREIVREAKNDARQMISVTLGEYMPMEGSEVSVDFDSAGLINWAKSRFGVELDAAELRGGGAAERKDVEAMLGDAAEQKIEESDLSGIEVYLNPAYGAQQLAEWADRKFGVTIRPDEIADAVEDEHKDPATLVMERARDLYKTREIEYPVDFSIDMTRMAMGQSPQLAMEQLVLWANRRYSLGWTVEKIKTTPPDTIRRELRQASQKFVESGKLDEAIEAALACKDDDELNDHIESTYEAIPGVPSWMRDLRDEDREQVVRGRIEGLLRTELLQLEQTVLLDTVDSTWKDHLYEMDQLRDAISFRAFSQEDPRIAFKREGSRLFKQMMQSIRDRVTDIVFKAKLSMGPPRGPAPARPAARPAPRAAAVPAGGAFSSTISGPGLAAGPAPTGPPTPEPADPDGSPQDQVRAARAAREADRRKKRTR